MSNKADDRRRFRRRMIRIILIATLLFWLTVWCWSYIPLRVEESEDIRYQVGVKYYSGGRGTWISPEYGALVDRGTLCLFHQYALERDASGWSFRSDLTQDPIEFGQGPLGFRCDFERRASHWYLRIEFPLLLPTLLSAIAVAITFATPSFLAAAFRSKRRPQNNETCR